MHSSVSRLLDYAKRHTAGSLHPVSGFPALQVRLQVSSASLTNWKQRGVSKEGAIKAEKEFGCSVNWVLTGKGPEDSSPRATQAGTARSSNISGPETGTPPSIREVVERLAAVAAKQRPTMRKNLANLLVDVATQPEDAALIEQTVQDIERLFQGNA